MIWIIVGILLATALVLYILNNYIAMDVQVKKLISIIIFIVAIIVIAILLFRGHVVYLK
jgi:hypothetical protein